MLPVAIYNQNTVSTPYLMNADGVAGTEPTNDDTGDRTLTLTSTAPEFVAIVASGFGIGSFGEVTGFSGSQCRSDTEFTTDLNPQGKDWCIEFMRIQRKNARSDSQFPDFTLETNSGTGTHQRVTISTIGASDATPPTASTSHVFEILTNSFTPTETVTMNTETILGVSGRYSNNVWRHHAIIRDEATDTLSFYIAELGQPGVLQMSDTGNGAGRLNGDQNSFRFTENFSPAHASPLHDSVRIVIGSTVYGTGATISAPTSSVGIF